ncbi:Myosin-15 [Saguinus oedipus]|uniref:Myosin-15 n=1 Tax=Saguinus oedipus TaxID=9490 RepID=A0ABQ9U499_SAGOE|nr:Myosin-15 [Saguinus oedipus]
MSSGISLISQYCKKGSSHVLSLLSPFTYMLQALMPNGYYQITDNSDPVFWKKLSPRIHDNVGHLGHEANAEKLCTVYEERLNEANAKLDKVTQLANDLTAQKTKLWSESGEFLRRLEEKEALVNQLSREKSNFTRQIEELRGQLEKETKSQSALAQTLQKAQRDCDLLREQYEEEQEVKSELHRTLSKVNAEMVQWRMKYESNAIQRTEDLEDAKKKLAIRLQEAAEAMVVASARNASLERTRHRLQLELGDALSDLGKVRSAAARLDQKQLQSGKALADWKQKHEELQVLLDASQKEIQALSMELFKLKHAYEESIVGQETLRRENKDLQEEISNLTNQVRERTKNLTEMEKVKKLIEQEKTEVQVTLEETEKKPKSKCVHLILCMKLSGSSSSPVVHTLPEAVYLYTDARLLAGALERNESKILRFQLELLEAKTELERKLSEKDEEIENFRRKQQCTIDYLQSSLDSEAKSRVEATRIKKKMEDDLSEMELQLSCANRQDLQMQLDDSTHLNSDLKDQVAMAERRNSLLQSELEELRSLQEQTERGCRLSEQELLEATERISLFYTQNTSLLSQKKKLEADVARMQKEAEEMVQECQNAEEKAKKAAVEAANLSEELKKKQDTIAYLERMRENMEQTITDLQKRLAEAEQTALMGSRKQIQKLESRVHELEGELEGEIRRSAEAQRGARRLERCVKELTYQVLRETLPHLCGWALPCRNVLLQA